MTNSRRISINNGVITPNPVFNKDSLFTETASTSSPTVETMFKWEFEEIDEDNFRIIITEVSEKIPVEKELFKSSNGVTFRKYGSTGFSDFKEKIFDLPESGWCKSNFIGTDEKELLEEALPEFHEFCVKTYGSEATGTIEENDAQRVIQGIEELVQQEHDNTLNSLKGLLKDRFNFLLEYPYDYSKGFIEYFLSDLVNEIDEF